MKTNFSDIYHLDHLDIRGDSLSARITLPENLIYFDGHFDQIQVLPGVVQMHWVIDLALRHLNVAGEFSGIDNMKFMRLIQPGQHLGLEISYNRAKDLIEFIYSDGDKKLSSGKIRFCHA